MALILAMQAGRSMYVGNTRVEVLEGSNPHNATVRVHHADSPTHDHHLSLDMRVQVLPGVFMCVGPGSGKSMIKIVIEAPRSVGILRDSLYEAASDKHQ